MTSKENQASTDFSTLALSPATLANLQQLGYTTMTPIQAAALPPALLGRDLIAHAERTGRALTVFQNRRWDGDFRTVSELVICRPCAQVSTSLSVIAIRLILCLFCTTLMPLPFKVSMNFS